MKLQHPWGPIHSQPSAERVEPAGDQQVRSRCPPRVLGFGAVNPLEREGQDWRKVPFSAVTRSHLRGAAQHANQLHVFVLHKQDREIQVGQSLWYPVTLNFNPVLKHCFVELFRRSLQEKLIRWSDAPSSPVALHRTFWLILFLRPRQRKNCCFNHCP